MPVHAAQKTSLDAERLAEAARCAYVVVNIECRVQCVAHIIPSGSSLLSLQRLRPMHHPCHDLSQACMPIPLSPPTPMPIRQHPLNFLIRLTSPGAHPRPTPRERPRIGPRGIQRATRQAARRTLCCVLVLLPMQGLAGQEDGAVEVVGQATVAAADLHGDDDELGDDAELGAESGVDGGVAQGDAHSAIRGDDFEEAG